ncbi:hypothetical protein SAMD00019534_101790 [Acytostelium subglobosum LB1]|uniref:hypothetical protein n=1 Tax=Acytostelium subglobosum LB1 TaxID=1410327 RepID=UPI0006452357|nr:hypothetical protein SAMD00019534_101790 [Acytostelium subglobosum LB1]GAM27004.1 hypothetical protein SAMD00019534_101790 [Acytostelium subglobosum LB1]|eukprot:XP_012749884.1 hypothetical protein SAMD00019534_101790 [Acytostelium subglobosum LB1]
MPDLLNNGSLTKLIFGRWYSKPITLGCLPNTLAILSFGSNYNQPLTKDVLPKSLTSLSLGKEYHSSVVFPSKLQSLQIEDLSQLIYLQQLPSSIESIEFRFIDVGNKASFTFDSMSRHVSSSTIQRLTIYASADYSCPDYATSRVVMPKGGAKAVQQRLIKSSIGLLKSTTVKHYRLHTRVKVNMQCFDQVVDYRMLDDRNVLCVYKEIGVETIVYKILPLLKRTPKTKIKGVLQSLVKKNT